jgi:hypothetical protein
MAAGKGLLASDTAKQRRRFGTHRVSSLLTGLLKPAARARGFAEASLLADWETIVGPLLARRCQPVAVKFPRGRHRGGVLELRAGGAVALELQHATPQIIDRINAYFGFPAIRQLKLLQAPLVPTPEPPPPRRRPLTPTEEQVLANEVMGVDDAQLRQALLSLGRTMRGARS